MKRVVSAKVLLCLIVVLVPVLLCVKFDSFARAQSTSSSPWVSDANPLLSTINPLVPTPLPYSINGNRDCSDNSKVITRPTKIFGSSLPQTEQSHTSCIVNTQYGGVDTQRYLIREGTNVGGKIYSESGLELKILPIPNSDTALSTSSGDFGILLNLVHNVRSRLSTEASTQVGEIDHRLRNDFDPLVRDERNQPLNASYESISFSGNGEWMVFDSPYLGLTRVHIPDGKLLLFDQGFAYNNGLNPSLQTAVSSDGRYAVVASATYGTFKLYDLESCNKSASLNVPATCQARNLQTTMQSQLPNYLNVGQIRFVDDNNIRFYSASLKDSVRTVRLQALSAPGYTPTSYGYLGLGDSFASGEGSYNYRTGTDIRNPLNKCHLSQDSYPLEIGASLALDSFNSVACSGAKLKDLNQYGLDKYSEDPQSNGRVDASFDSEVFSGFLSGYRTQLEFVKKYKPKAITLSVIGNDIGFGDIVRTCAMSVDTCYDSPGDRANLANTINFQYNNLVTLYGQLKEASPATKIYIVGYPSLVKEGGNCANNVHANASELVFFNNTIHYLNSVIEKATKKAGVNYINVENILDGVRLCETNSGLVAVNGLTAGDDKFFDIGPIGKESFHPNARSQALFRDRIITTSESLSKPNPQPDVSIISPTLADASTLINSASGAEQLKLKVLHFDDSLVDDLIYKNSPVQIHAGGLRPGSTVNGTLFSSPTSLGIFSVDAGGNLSATTSIPGSIEPGYHTLHISGQNVAGEDVDIQKSFFVASSAEDLDGDGMNNTVDPCTGIAPSGVDYDQDGIDDACDGDIGLPPPLPPTPTTPIETTPRVTEVIQPTEPIPPIDELPIGEIVVLRDPPNDPVITPLPEPENKDGLGESVAGLEVLVAPEPETVAVAPPVATPAVSTPSVAHTSGPVVAMTQPAVTQTVLGESGAVDSAKTSTPIDTQTATLAEIPKERGLGASYWLLAVFVVLFGFFFGRRIWARARS